MDSLEDLASAINRTVTAFGLPTATVEEVRARIGHGARELVRRSVGDQVPLDQAVERFFSEYGSRLVDRTRPYQGMVDLLDALGAAGVVRAVATNKPARLTGPLLEALRLTPRLDGWASGDEAARKPDPASVVLALSRAGASDLTPASVVYVGDMGVDIATARSFGARAIGVTWGFEGPAIRDAQPDLVVETVDALRQALAV